MALVKAFLGLGTNMGDRANNLVAAREHLSGWPVDIEQVSPVYISEPWGFKSENDFFNQVIEIKTGIDAFSLLDFAQDTEKKMGRIRSVERYSDRVIDIDILFFGDEIISSKPLIIPHPLLHKRMFVLQPLADIAPGFIHPVLGKTISEILDECDDKPGLHL